MLIRAVRIVFLRDLNSSRGAGAISRPMAIRAAYARARVRDFRVATKCGTATGRISLKKGSGRSLRRCFAKYALKIGAM